MLRAPLQAIAARSWKAVDQEAAELLHALPETLTKVRSELWMGLALSRFHQRQSDETVIEAADVRFLPSLLSCRLCST